MTDIEDLIIRSLQGRASPSEEDRLRRWRDARPGNERRFQELRRLWLAAGLGASAVEDRPSADVIVDHAEAPTIGLRQIADPPPDPGSGPPDGRREAGAAAAGAAEVAGRPRRGWWSRVRTGALAAGLVAVGFGLASLVGDSGSAPEGAASTTVVETGPGEMTTVTLSDGSSVRVGPHSWLRTVETPEQRRVELEGRAFFGVEEDPARTFVVETPHGQAVALGTRFEVRTEEDFRVLVVDGRVSVSVDEAAVEVTGGEMSRATRGQPPSKTAVPDIYGELAWMGNHLAFRGTPLGEAAREIERRYGMTVAVELDSLEQIPVTATFTGRSVGDVVSVLCEILEADCVVDAATETIRIGRREGTRR